MKKLILAILLFTVLFAGDIVKEIDYNVPVGHCSYAIVKYAKPYGSNYIFYADLLDADSSMIANNCYFLDTKSPFLVTSAELDSLLKWNPDYIPPEE